MATGANPFSRDTGPQTIAAILETKPRLDIKPQSLSTVVNRCLNKDPSERYVSTRELASELRAIQHGMGGDWRVTRRSAIAAGVAAIAVISGITYWAVRGRPVTTQERILAVRTFKNLSSDPGQDYFSGGLTEEVRSRLSKVSSIRLLSRSAVDGYSDGDVKRMAAELKAAHLVEGTVRADKNRVLIAVQLIDTQTLQTLWSEQYDRALDDILSVQNDVALRVTESLRMAVTPAERRRLERRPTMNAAAYNLVSSGAEVHSPRPRFDRTGNQPLETGCGTRFEVRRGNGRD